MVSENSLKRTIKNLTRSFDSRMRYYAQIPEVGRVLDLGCGPGTNGTILRQIRPKLEYHGIDIVIHDEVPEFYCAVQADLDNDKLPYPDEYFDAIIFTHVIEHLSKTHLLGSEIHRVLKKGGTIYVETPNWTTTLVPSFGFHREQHYPFNFYDDSSHIKPWTKHGLFEFLFQSCRIEVQKVGCVRNWLRVPFDFPAIIYGLIAGKRWTVVSAFWNLYGWCIYAIGRKSLNN